MAAVIRKETGANPIFAVPRYSNAAESDMLVTIAVENSGKTISNNDRKMMRVTSVVRNARIRT